MAVEAAGVDLEHLQAPRRRRRRRSTPSPLTWAKSRTRFSSRLATRGVPRERPAIVVAPRGVDLDPEDPGRALDDQRQVLGLVVLEPVADAEAVAQRRRQQARPGSSRRQRERRQRQGHGAGAGALAEHDRQLAVLHRRVERLLDRAAEAVDLVDEEDAARLQRGEEGGDVGLALERRAGGLDHRHAELGGDDVGERGLAEPGRAGEQDVVERLAAPPRRLDEDRQLVGDLTLVDEVGRAAAAAASGRGPRPRLGARVVRSAARRRPAIAASLSGIRSIAIAHRTASPTRRRDRCAAPTATAPRRSRRSPPRAAARPRAACSRG